MDAVDSLHMGYQATAPEVSRTRCCDTQHYKTIKCLRISMQAMMKFHFEPQFFKTHDHSGCEI